MTGRLSYSKEARSTPAELLVISEPAVLFSLFRLVGRNGFRLLDGAQPFSYRRASRDKPHALAETFAFSGGLAGIPVGGMNGCPVSAQTHFSRRLGHEPPALGVSRGPLFVLWLGLAHGTPPVTGSWRKPNLQSKMNPPRPCLLVKIISFYRGAFQYPQVQAKLGQRPRPRFKGIPRSPNE